MTKSLSRRKARVDSSFSVSQVGDPPLLIPAGPYVVDEFAGEVAMRPERGEASGMLMLSTQQFQNLIDQRRVVFVSW